MRDRPPSDRRHELARLVEGDVRRQRRDLGIGDRLDHDRPVAADSARPCPARSPRVGRRGCRSARASRRSARTGSRAAPARPSNLGSPSMTRCSQVTWLRSWLLSTSTTSCGLFHSLPVLGRRDEAVDAVHLHRAVADAGDRPGDPGARTWPRWRRARPAPIVARLPDSDAIMPSPQLQVAGAPVGRGAGVGGHDGPVGQARRQLDEHALRVDRIGARAWPAPP